MATDSQCQQDGASNNLVREGRSQQERFSKALDPAYVSIDEQKPEHVMVFAKAYSAYLRYYDSSNIDVDDWKRFFSEDVSVKVAEAAIQNVDDYRIKVKGYFDFLKNRNNLLESKKPALRDHLGYLFSAVGSMAKQLELLKERLPADLALKSALQNLVVRQLAPALKKLIAYYHAGKNLDLIADVCDLDLKIFECLSEPFIKTYQSGLSEDWVTGDAKTWNNYIVTISPNYTVYGSNTTVLEKFSHCATHNLFSGVFDQFLKGYSSIVIKAQTELAESLSNRDDHQPHYALFLAFLRLMEFEREHINTLTRRHLAFYYKEFLQLKDKPSEPNHVHLLVQLPKHFESALLKAGTAFKGKDGKGKTLLYSLNEDFVPNIARVVKLESVYHKLQGMPARMYAFPVANSEDGRGAALSSPDKQWHPFIGKTEEANLATMGFAISSHYLLLGEGARKIRLTLTFTEALVSEKELADLFDFWLTGEKGWVQATLFKPESFSNKKAQTVIIKLLLDGSHPPVVPLTADIHGQDLPTGLPVLKAVLKQKDTGLPLLQQVQQLTLLPGQCGVDVCVGYSDFDALKPEESGLKSLGIFTKFGEVKPDKPFQPFGPLPEIADYLIIGCDEVFQKSSAEFQFRIVWKGLPGWRGDIDFDWINEFFPDLNLTFLKSGNWSMMPDLEHVQVFYSTRPDIYFPSKKRSLPKETVSDVHFDRAPYTQTSRNGFLKLSLSGNFGHKLYHQTLSRYLLRLAKDDKLVELDRMALWNNIKSAGKNDPLYSGILDKLHQAKGNTSNSYDRFTELYVEYFSRAMPVEPYTPEIESLSLSYTAFVPLTDTTMYWLMPFGYKALSLKQKEISLLPVFGFEGEFCIGIQGLKPGQSVSMLFQLAEGSASPVVLKPENHLHWSYLRDNEWVELKNTELSDDTGQLTRSGIIRFAVPKDATNDDTLFLPSGYHWLRVVVADRSEAVCRIITIDAQAAQATLLQQQDAFDLSPSQLPEGTVTKLATPDAAIKTVEQPYPTFGGRPVETSAKFYTRVSERLRHKNRAVTLWDYEQLILEAFPQLYKVKCLNHTSYEPSESGSGIYPKLAPGHVTVITIPNLRNHNAIDPLRPYTNLGELDVIKKYLARHVSGFVCLHVHNPIFESILADFRVKFYPGIDEAFYTDLIRKELVQFLSPWAFEEGKDISFGGKIYKSSLIDFVEERSYVDYVTDFKLFHIDGDKKKSNDTDEVTASTAMSILVSAAAEEHHVVSIAESETMVQRAACDCQRNP
jgi:hypothetical protein